MHALIGVVIVAQGAFAALPPDSVKKLRDQARSAEAHFERQSRRLAPLTWSAPGGHDCDEIVGRFCLTFDANPAEAPPGEAGRVVDARRDAIEAVRRYFSAAPAERRAAGPLVRLLIADGRAPEAVSAAAAFAALSGDSLWGPLLVGMASHAAGVDDEAEAQLDRALAALDAEERRRWLEPDWLLDPGERRRIRRLDPAARAEYERRFWILSDPFWATPANEFRTEHISRHAQTRLLAEVPLVGGMYRWGDDLAELTVRYGVPTARRQTRGTLTQQSTQIEYWDSAGRAFAPQRLSEGFGTPPVPGEKPPLYDERARSTWAPHRYDRVLALPHQVSRFVRGDSVLLRVDVDAAELPDGDWTEALVIYDSALVHSSSRHGRRSAGTDGTAVLFAAAAPGALVYSAEIIAQADSQRVGARARHALEALIPSRGPVLSDMVLARAFGQSPPRSAEDPALRGVGDLTVASGDTIGVFAEVYRAGRDGITVDLVLEPADRPSLLRQVGGWIGRTLGLSQPTEHPRLAWQDQGEEGRYVIALDLPLDSERRGMFDLVLRVSNREGTTETRRRFLVR